MELKNDNRNLTKYYFRVDAVKRSIEILSQRQSHDHFPGYLALLSKNRNGKNNRMQVSDIEEFFHKYLTVEGAPDQRPYLQPFRSRGTKVVLLNRNLQGSYAPSSIREGSPFSKVVDLVTQDSTGRKLNKVEYRLAPDHSDIALADLLKGERVPIIALAVFLFRDYGVYLEEPSKAELVEAFSLEFDLGIDSEVFKTLFFDDGEEFTNDELFFDGLEL
ncbi:MAG: hypothetical protein AAF572_27105 [Cyanobacteria bacterium P01_B01_bin.77]